jgi:hypothetical protein
VAKTREFGILRGRHSLMWEKKDNYFEGKCFLWLENRMIVLRGSCFFEEYPVLFFWGRLIVLRGTLLFE